MATGAGKAAQPAAAAAAAAPGSTVNGTAAELPNIEQELYDYQMHSKMCKKIAQLTKVRPACPERRAASCWIIMICLRVWNQTSRRSDTKTKTKQKR